MTHNPDSRNQRYQSTPDFLCRCFVPYESGKKISDAESNTNMTDNNADVNDSAAVLSVGLIYASAAARGAPLPEIWGRFMAPICERCVMGLIDRAVYGTAARRMPVLTATAITLLHSDTHYQACRGYEISHPYPYPYPQMPILCTCSHKISTKTSQARVSIPQLPGRRHSLLHNCYKIGASKE